MRATPRPQLLGLLVIAFLAMGGLLWAWLDAQSDGFRSADEPLHWVAEGSTDELRGGGAPSEGTLTDIERAARDDASEALPLSGAMARERTASQGRVAAGAKRLEYRAVLLVSDGASGQAVTGAVVTEVLWGGVPLARESGWRATEADDQGFIEVICRLPEEGEPDAEDPGLRRFDLKVAAAGYVGVAAMDVQAELDLDLDSDSAGGRDRDDGRIRDVTLYASGSLVLDVLGAPSTATGALALWFAPGVRERDPDIELAWPVLDAEAKVKGVSLMPSVGGSTRLVFHDLPPGPLSVALAVVGSPVAMEQALTLQSGERVEQSLRLLEGEVANGIIRELTTRVPMPGVTVVVSPRLEELSERINRLPYPPQVTDERGAFSILGLPHGELDVELHTPDGVKHPRKIFIVEGNMARRHELKVRGSASLSGRVIATDGLTLSQVKVLVTTEESSKNARPSSTGFSIREGLDRGVYAEVDPTTGRFVAEAVPSGRKLAVHALSDGSDYAMALIGALKLDESREDIEISLGPRPAVLFRVEAANGEALDAITVSFLGNVEAGIPGGETRSVNRWGPAERLEVQPDGLVVAGSAFPTLKKIRLNWEGRARTDEVWPEGTLDEIPTFTLVPNPRVLVQVVGTEGEAVFGARVRASVPKAAAPPRGSGKRPSSSVTTDGFGRAYLRLPFGQDGTVPSPLDLRVAAKGYLSAKELTIDEGDALPAPPRVIVLERAEPLVPAMITGRLVRGNGEPLIAPRFDGLRGGAAHVDEHTFELRGIRPGRVKAIVHCDRFESKSLPRLNLRPGERYDVGEIVMRAATRLSVTVKSSQGRTLKDAQVLLYRLPARQAGRKGLPKSLSFPGKPDSRGLYTRANVPRAKWRLVVKHRGHVTHQEIVELKKSLQSVQVRLKAKP
jgi:hypothetical protein